MNLVQALAVAAAALVLAGDPWSATWAQTEARLAALAARGHAITHQLVAAAHARIVEEPCGKLAFASARPKHALPDTSIHAASRAARL